MNNINNRSFTERGRELLDQLKQFIIDVNSNTTNKQVQLNTIIAELEDVQKKVSNIHIKFLKKYNFLKGTSDGPEEYPNIMQMDAYLAKLQDNKNKEEKNKKNEETRLAEEKRKLNEAKTANIANKSKIIRETIEKLRINIGNSNASSNKPPNISNNGRPNKGTPNNGTPNNVRPNNVRPNNLVSHPLKPNMRALENELRNKLANRRRALGYNSPPPSNNRKLINIPNNRTKFSNAKRDLVARLAGGNKSVQYNI